MNTEEIQDGMSAEEEIWIRNNVRAKMRSVRKDYDESSEKIDKDKKRDITEQIIDNANSYFLIKILSPEITKNEDRKRQHKNDLINIVKIFLIAQFITLFFLLFGIIIMIFIFHGMGNDLELSYIKTIIGFISVYITSVVVELIAMLKYIVSNVFDTSITGLVEFYKDAGGK